MVQIPQPLEVKNLRAGYLLAVRWLKTFEIMCGKKAKVTFGFLLRFKLAQGRFISVDKEEIKITLPGIQHALTLSTVSDDLISSTSNLQIRGTGFETEKEARDIGFKIKNSLLASCPISDIGIDAGKERARSYLGKSIKDMLLEEGIRHLDDIHGVQVFKEDEKSLSVSYSRGAGVIISKEEQMFLKELNKAYQVVDSLDENVLLACELYGAAQFENTRAQFILYVSAIEALAGEPIKKSDDEIRLVDHLLNKVDEFFNNIENGEELTVDKERFKSQLGNLKNVSISQSCFKFVEEKLGQEMAKKFKVCYNARGSLLHEGTVNEKTNLSKLTGDIRKMLKDILLLIIDKNSP